VAEGNQPGKGYQQGQERGECRGLPAGREWVV